MQKALEKVKPILYLLTLSITAFGIVWIVNQFKGTNTYATDEISTQGEILVDETASQFVSIEEITPMEVTQDTVGQVLAADPSESNQCKEAFNTYNTIEVCTASGGDVDYKKGILGTNYVSKNSRVYLTEVTVPLVLLSGSKYVKDSNRIISTDDPLYKPAGEQFTYKEANIERAPGDNIANATVSKPYSTRYSIAFGEVSDKPTDEGELVMSEKIPNSCEYCNNLSNPNPDKTNKISEYLYNSRYSIPGGYTSIDTSKDDEIQSCSDKDTFRELEKSSYSACKMSLIDQFLVKITAAISAPIFNECNTIKYDENNNIITPSDNCIRAEDIIVKVSSMFGSETECADGVCTNIYMSTRNKTALTPKESESYTDNVFYLTPCKAIIEGERGDVDIMCAWDLSYLFKERQVAEFDDVIGVDKTPSKGSYDRFLIKDAQERDGEPAIEM